MTWKSVGAIQPGLNPENNPDPDSARRFPETARRILEMGRRKREENPGDDVEIRRWVYVKNVPN